MTSQARVTATLRETRITRETDEGAPVGERGRGLADEVALARREPASQGSRHLGLATALVQELPHTLEHLAAGTVSEWGATVMARETAVLEPEDRRRVDVDLDERLGTMTVRQIERAARGLTLAVDATAVARRRARAKADRRVSIRPQPDTMASVTALLPVEQGVAAWSALTRDAEALKAAGDGRGVGQLMADLFVERLTGQPRADAVPIEVHLVMGPGALLGAGDVPATLPGHEPLPAALARELLAGPLERTEDAAARAWLRRVFTDEVGRVVSVDPRRRRFPPMSVGCCGCATACAGSPSATLRSATTTTSSRECSVGPRPRRTGRVSVLATTRRSHVPGGRRARKDGRSARRQSTPVGSVTSSHAHPPLPQRGAARGDGSGGSGPVGRVCGMTVPLGRPRRMTARRAISGSARA